MEEKTKERIKKLKREVWNKRIKKIKIFLVFFIFLIFFFGIYQLKKAILYYLWNLEIFSLKEIKVSPSDLKPLITETIGLEPGKNLLFLDIEEINRKISQLRFVEKSKIKKILPSTIEIEITIRKPWIMIKSEKYTTFVDTSGIVVSPPELPENYWKVKGIEIENFSVIDSDKEKIDVLKEIEKWYNFFNIGNLFKIVEIDISNLEKIILSDGEREIYVATENIKEKFEDLKIVLEECISKNYQWEYIELRFKNPYVKKNPKF